MAMEDTTGPRVPDAFMLAVGSLALNWAAIESSLDFAITVIYNVFPFRGIEENAPQNLGRKLKLIRKALRDKRLEAIREPARRLIVTLTQHKDDRNNIIHGAILDAPGEQIISLRIRYTKGGHTLTTHVVKTSQVEEYSKVALALCDRTIALSVAIYNVARPDKPIDHPLGEFAA